MHINPPRDHQSAAPTLPRFKLRWMSGLWRDHIEHFAPQMEREGGEV